MTDVVRDSYNVRVKEYANFNLYDLDRAPLDREWLGTFARIVSPSAGMLVSFFASDSPVTHGLPFDHAVVTAYALFPETLVAELQTVGFDRFESSTRRPQDGERSLDHGTILARRGTS